MNQNFQKLLELMYTAPFQKIQFTRNPTFLNRWLQININLIIIMIILLLALAIILVFPYSFNSVIKTVTQPVLEMADRVTYSGMVMVCKYLPTHFETCSKRNDSLAIIHKLTVEMHKPLPSTTSLESVQANLLYARKTLSKQNIEVFF